MASTPTRNIRVPDNEWHPAQIHAARKRETITDVIRRALRRYPDESYRAEIWRDGPWWMIRVPEIDGITQARYESEVWPMTRDLIAVTLDIDINTVNVELVMLPTAKAG
jgi:hypothetical protein